MNFEILSDDMPVHSFDIGCLGDLKRRELQDLAKKCSIKANM